MKKQFFILVLCIAALNFTGCSSKASDSSSEKEDRSSKVDSINKRSDEPTVTPEDEQNGTFSTENLKQYQEAFINGNAKFNNAQLKEIKSWLHAKTPKIVSETDKMIDAVHKYTYDKTGHKYDPCSWEDDFRPDKLPEVYNWAMYLMSIDGINLMNMLSILQNNDAIDLYDKNFRYKSKDNYYLFNIYAMSSLELFSEFLNTGILGLQSGYLNIDEVRAFDDRERELLKQYE